MPFQGLNDTSIFYKKNQFKLLQILYKYNYFNIKQYGYKKFLSLHK